MKFTDLHTHTTYSDGSNSPREIIKAAAENDVDILAISDHDTLDAYRESDLFSFATNHNVRLIPSVEITAISKGDIKCHVLGIDVSLENVGLQNSLAILQNSRKRYAESMVELIRHQNWQMDESSIFNQSLITKATVADSVISEPANYNRLANIFGTIRPSRGTFIEHFMNKGCELFIPRQSISTEEAVSIIHSAGGIAVLAHPVAMTYEQGLQDDDIISLAKRASIDALEAYYCYYHKSDHDREIDAVNKWIALAQENGLAVSGGSDFHGFKTSIGKTPDVGLKGFPHRFTTEMAHSLLKR